MCFLVYVKNSKTVYYLEADGLFPFLVCFYFDLNIFDFYILFSYTNKQDRPQ